VIRKIRSDADLPNPVDDPSLEAVSSSDGEPYTPEPSWPGNFLSDHQNPIPSLHGPNEYVQSLLLAEPCLTFLAPVSLTRAALRKYFVAACWYCDCAAGADCCWLQQRGIDAFNFVDTNLTPKDFVPSAHARRGISSRRRGDVPKNNHTKFSTDRASARSALILESFRVRERARSHMEERAEITRLLSEMTIQSAPVTPFTPATPRFNQGHQRSISNPAIADYPDALPCQYGTYTAEPPQFICTENYPQQSPSEAAIPNQDPWEIQDPKQFKYPGPSSNHHTGHQGQNRTQHNIVVSFGKKRGQRNKFRQVRTPKTEPNQSNKDKGHGGWIGRNRPKPVVRFGSPRSPLQSISPNSPSSGHEFPSPVYESTQESGGGEQGSPQLSKNDSTTVVTSDSQW
jgi:hypothetical protein